MIKLRAILFAVVLLFHCLSFADAIIPCDTPKFTPQNISSHLNEMCSVIIKSDLCKEVDPTDLLKCNSISNESQVDLWSYVKGCAVGAFESAKDILSFLWEVVSWVWSNSTSSEARDVTSDHVSEYSHMAKLYLHTEYVKAYALSSPPFKELDAVKQMGGAVSKLLLDSLGKMISKKYEEFGCLNSEAKSRVTCKLVGDIFLPPTGALALLKYGPKAFKQLPNITTLLKINKSILPARIIKYNTVTMRRRYIGEEKGKYFKTKVKYLTAAEREKLKISISNDGKFLDANGLPLNVKNGLYVMDATGEIFIHPENVVGVIHHSTIVAGKPVAAAGEITIVDGIVKYVDRNSGHYHPKLDHYNQFLKELDSLGVKLEEGVVSFNAQ